MLHLSDIKVFHHCIYPKHGSLCKRENEPGYFACEIAMCDIQTK